MDLDFLLVTDTGDCGKESEIEDSSGTEIDSEIEYTSAPEKQKSVKFLLNLILLLYIFVTNW